MKPQDETGRSLTREDRELIDAIEAGLRPRPMDPVRAARFRRAVEERLERPRTRWRAGLVVAAPAAAGAALWLAIPDAPSPAPTEVAVEEPEANDEVSPLLYADAEAYDQSLTPEDYLPEDYLALASVLDLDA